MSSLSLFQSETFSLIIVPLLIFLSRIVDVSIGTLRIMFVSRGLRYLAAFLGFFEVLIWIIAIGQVMQNLTAWYTYVAYALGFAAGNFVGISIENRLAMGNLVVRIISRGDNAELSHALWESGFGVTTVEGWGETGPVKVIFTVVRRKKLKEVIKAIKTFQPKAFYSVEDVRYVTDPTWGPSRKRTLLGMKTVRKGK